MSDENFETPTLTSSLNEAPAQGESTPEAAPVETKAPVETPSENPTPEVATPAPKVDPEATRNVPLAALQAERRKRQEVEQRLAQLQQPTIEATPNYLENPEAAIAAAVQQATQPYAEQITAQSEYMARQAHPDFDEKWNAFCEACIANPPLFDQAMAKGLPPGEAAYQEGERILFEKKYGSDRKTQMAKIREEAKAELRKEVEAEFLGKLEARGKQPTNILTQRAANGAADSQFKMPTFSSVLGS